jgi:deazaflavin-dependent oxidoreductase (nitroreductase family)
MNIPALKHFLISMEEKMTATRDSANALRQGFKVFNRFMVLMFRLGTGPAIWQPAPVGKIMVITHTGRKSGLTRRTPVNYALIDGDIYCIAGFGPGSDWYRNILSNPQVEVWLPGGWWEGTAEDVSGNANRLPILRQVLVNSGFAAYVAGINPKKINAEQLTQLTAPYRLVRIHRTAPRTGPGGPGDMAWVWQGAGIFLLGLLLLRRKK